MVPNHFIIHVYKHTIIYTFPCATRNEQLLVFVTFNFSEVSFVSIFLHLTMYYYLFG